VQRRTYKPDLKAKVALEAVKASQTTNEIASQFTIHPNMVTQWKKTLVSEAATLFSDKRERQKKDEVALRDNLYQQIGQLKVELDWLKKKIGMLD
jgi:putative transposase